MPPLPTLYSMDGWICNDVSCTGRASASKEEVLQAEGSLQSPQRSEL